MKKQKLTLLGTRVTRYPDHPDDARLEAIPFRARANRTTVLLTSDEFTSLCPVTSQPDFGEIIIEYVPRSLLVESKSLKLYLFSFRNVGIFQEEIVNRILDDLKHLLSPRFIKVTGKFKPRGSVHIHPTAEWGTPAPFPPLSPLDSARGSREGGVT
ncbi:MAG: preQ(1) synthase [Fibrobacterota bacterium]